MPLVAFGERVEEGVLAEPDRADDADSGDEHAHARLRRASASAGATPRRAACSDANADGIHRMVEPLRRMRRISFALRDRVTHVHPMTHRGGILHRAPAQCNCTASIMLITDSKRPRSYVAPTLVEAVQAARHLDHERGFVFVRAGRHRALLLVHRRSTTRPSVAARTSRAQGLEKGDRARDRRPRSGRVRPLVPRRDLRGRHRPGADLPAALVQERRDATTTPSRTSRTRPARRCSSRRTATRQYVDPVLPRVAVRSASIVTVDELAAPAPRQARRRRSSPTISRSSSSRRASTSRPKGVIVTHGNLACEQRELHDPRPREGLVLRQGRELAPALPRHGAHRLRRSGRSSRHPRRVPADGELRAQRRASGSTRSTSTAARSRTRRTSRTRSSRSA